MSIFRRIIYVVLVSFLFIQCAKENQYLIEKGKVGYLNKKTTILELSTIFKNDSITSNLALDSASNEDRIFSLDDDEYLIFSAHAEEKKGRHYLQIFNRNYKKDKGISLQSTFKDSNENYMVNKVETTLTSATLFIDELNATIAIDKKELGLNSFSREEITIDQIPDIAKIKYFTIWFN